MANRYWVGGAGTWNTSSTTNWSASSGGASGASVPTASDSVFFDQATTYTVTCTGALTCLDITVSAGTVTFATGTSPTFAISGSMSLVAATVWSATGAITFNATTTGKTVTTNGVSLSGAMVFNGVGGGWTLGGALTTSSTTTLTNGTLALSTFTYTTTTFSSANSNTRTISFGTGNFVCSGTGTVWTTATTTGLTITGTPVVNVTSSGSTAITVNPGVFITEASTISFNFTGGTYALTFLGTASHVAKNVSFTGFAGTWNAVSTCSIYGNLTLSTGMTLTASTSRLSLRATSGTQTITTNGKTLDFPLGIFGSCIVVFVDALTLGSTRSLQWTSASGSTIKFTSGTTNTIGSFSDLGDTTLKYLQSTVAGSQATLSCASGIVQVTAVSIKDSNATGGAVFDATASGNINAGNNTGWLFSSGASNFFLMFE